MTNLHDLPYRLFQLTDPIFFSRRLMLKFEVRHADSSNGHLPFMKGFPYMPEVMGEEKPVSSEDTSHWMLNLLAFEEGDKGKESVK